MTDVSIHQFLTLYTWFPLAALLLFMLLIARFYHKFSRVATYHWLYLVPIILYGFVFVRMSSLPPQQSDLVIHVISAIAGGCLLFLSILLLRLMMTRAQA